jgi:hypothetical protein
VASDQVASVKANQASSPAEMIGWPVSRNSQASGQSLVDTGSRKVKVSSTTLSRRLARVMVRPCWSVNQHARHAVDEHRAGGAEQPGQAGSEDTAERISHTVLDDSDRCRRCPETRHLRARYVRKRLLTATRWRVSGDRAWVYLPHTSRRLAVDFAARAAAATSAAAGRPVIDPPARRLIEECAQVA